MCKMHMLATEGFLMFDSVQKVSQRASGIETHLISVNRLVSESVSKNHPVTKPPSSYIFSLRDTSKSPLILERSFRAICGP